MYAAMRELCNVVLHPQVDSKGQNFLHLAILNQDVEAVIFLMSINVNVNSKVQNPTQNTPLHYAIKGGSEILARHLVCIYRSHDLNFSAKYTCIYTFPGLDHLQMW